MFALPSALADQNDRDACISDEIVADTLSNGFGAKSLIVYITVGDGSVDDVVPHHPDEIILVALVLMMKANEDLVSGRLAHQSSCSKSILQYPR